MPRPRALIAPDSFKGCLSAQAAALSIGRGFTEAGFETDLMPIADGGEGFVETLVASCGGRTVPVTVEGPLGNPVKAHYGLLGDGSIVIETAAASGLTLTDDQNSDRALYASTYGTGQLLKHAVEHYEHPNKRILFGLGGSATTDCGAGLLMAIGARLTGNNSPIGRGGAALSSLDKLDLSGAKELLSGYEIVASCDVDNPLFGKRGAAEVFGPQKGATPSQVAILDSALSHFHSIAMNSGISADAAQTPGAGAAGGLGYALICLGAKLRGAELVLEASKAGERIAACDIVVVGEGRTDVQTVHGKAPVAVARLAKAAGVPAVLLSGAICREGTDPLSLYRLLAEEGIVSSLSISDGPMTLADAMSRADELLCATAYNIAKLILRSMKNG